MIDAATTKNAADDGSPGTSSSNGSPARRARRARVRPSTVDRRAERARASARCGRALGAGDDDLGRRRRPGARRAAAPSSPGRSRPRARGACPRSAPPRIDERRARAVVAAVDVRAHRAQRLDDPRHRPLAQRRVAGEHRRGTAGPRARPASTRIVVPELPQSITSSGSRQPVDARARARRSRRRARRGSSRRAARARARSPRRRRRSRGA